MERQDVINAIKALCLSKFAGDYQAGFNFYDVNKTGQINKAEVEVMLTDAGIGSWMTRGLIAGLVISETGTNGAISYAQFMAAMA